MNLPDFRKKLPMTVTLNGNFSSVYAVEVSKKEYLTYTTEKKEKERMLQAESRYGSFTEALNQLNTE